MYLHIINSINDFIYKGGDRMSCCNCNKKNLIRTVQKYNLLIRLSERLFDKSEELLNKTARKEIIEAIKTLCNASRTYDQARACKRVAEKSLREDICGNVCNTNSNRCKELKDSANEQFDLSEEYIERAVCSLKNALNMIDKSIEAKEKGCILELRYEECIKTSNNTECESNTNCENNINFFEYIDCLNSTEELVNTDSISEIGSLSELDSFRDSENINSQENLSELDSFGDSENINSQEDLSELDSFRDSENINSQEDLSELDSFRDLENINLQENLSGGDNFDVEEEFL